MKVFSGNLATSQEAAIELAATEAGVPGVTMGVSELFETAIDTNRAETEAQRAINAALKNRYGGKATWNETHWLVPIPKLQYQSREFPQLTIETNTYLVASARVRVLRESFQVSLIGPTGKPETMALPMVFLHAILEEDLGRFAITARDGNYTTWEVPGCRPVRLPNNFVDCLDDELYTRSVVDWLAEFGRQGDLVTPLVAGSLFGLAFQGSAQPAAINEEMMTTDSLVSALESMAYQPAEAREMVVKAAPGLRADMTLEEAIRITLQKVQGGN